MDTFAFPKVICQNPSRIQIDKDIDIQYNKCISLKLSRFTQNKTSVINSKHSITITNSKQIVCDKK